MGIYFNPPSQIAKIGRKLELVQDVDIERDEFYQVQWCDLSVPPPYQYWDMDDPEERYDSANFCETLAEAQERVKVLDAYFNKYVQIVEYRIMHRTVTITNQVVG